MELFGFGGAASEGFIANMAKWLALAKLPQAMPYCRLLIFSSWQFLLRNRL